MRTPREFLLDRHAHVQPKLDQIALLAAGVQECQSPPARAILTLLRNWLWPSPLAWGAVAAIWLAIICGEFAAADHAHPAPNLASQTPKTIDAIREQKRLYAELLGMPSTKPAPFVPRPRSEVSGDFDRS